MQHFRSIPAQPTIHPTTRERVEPCEFANLPSFLKGRHQYQWSLSMASLSNVHAVRMSQGGGIELRYRNFSKCLGDFRPSKALDLVQDPVYFKVFRVSEMHHTITFFGEEDENRDAEALPLSGRYISFWSSELATIRVAINPITQSKLFDLIELNSNRSNRSEACDNSIKSNWQGPFDLI
jgi:hypothetical protein